MNVIRSLTSLAVAATRLRRNFIGFEREPEYVKIANQRLEKCGDDNQKMDGRGTELPH